MLRQSWLRIALWLGLAGLGLGLIGAGALAIYVVRVTADLPGIADLEKYEPPVMTRVHAGDGKLIAEYARESRVFVPIESIPQPLIAAFLSAEDKNFFSHGGVDWLGFVRANIRNLQNLVTGRGGPLEGASTVTQQVAKNFKLTASQTIERKVQEMALAFRIEEAFTKDEILELYLNEIYLGRRAYGVAAASLLYFGKPLDELTLAEAAYLAALPKAPNNYNPERNRERAIGRRNWVLERMVVNGYITREEAEAAQQDDLVVSERLTGTTYLAAEYFTEEVRRLVFGMYGEEELYDGGLSIRTTLDTRLQLAARAALRAGLEDYDRRRGGWRGPLAQIELGQGWEARLAEVSSPSDVEPWRLAVVLGVDGTDGRIGFADGTSGRLLGGSEIAWARPRLEPADGPVNALVAVALGPAPDAVQDILAPGDVVFVAAAAEPDAFTLRQTPQINGGLIAMDPHTGRVLALVGGYSFRESQFNRVTQGRRQPGSAFKPFVYLAALEQGYTPVSKVLDAPYVSISGDGSGFYRPANYTDRWYGLSTLRVGIEQSRNTMTVRLANDMGLQFVSDIGQRFGIYDQLPPYEAMALGAGETSLWRLAAAYAMIVNGGKEITPTILDRVQDRTGATIYRHDQRACPGCVRSPAGPAPAAGETAAAPAPTPASGPIVEPVLPDPRAQVIDPVPAYQMVSMLEGAATRGTAGRLRALGKPIAGKTGTTNDFRDAWFVGFTPDLVVGVSLGFDQPRAMGEGESGGRLAVPIVQQFLGEALKDAPATPFRIPPGARLVRVDATTGALARPGAENVILEAFAPGSEPTRFGDDGAEIGGFAAFDRAAGGVRIGAPDEPGYEPAPGLSPPSDPYAAVGAPELPPVDPPPDPAASPFAPLPAEPEAGREDDEEDDLGGLY